MEKRLNKRGISQVVTTLLFVLIALGAVLLVWTLVRGTITTSSDQIKVDEACLKLELTAKSCTYVAGTTAGTYDATVTYSRGNKDPGLSVAGVKLVFENAATKETSTKDATTTPGLLETKTDIQNLAFVPAEVSVAGVLTAESGNDVPCPLGEAIVCQGP